MSIIVYRDGVLAADSGAWTGDFITSSSTKKVFKVRGHLLGIVGHYAIGLAFVDEFLRTGKFLKSLTAGDKTSLIIVTPARRAFVCTEGHMERCSGFVVAGSEARGIALGALHMGATAQRAVRIAIKVGPWTSGKVQSVRL